jgi:hypothetical protein
VLSPWATSWQVTLTCREVRTSSSVFQPKTLLDGECNQLPTM